VAVNQTIGQQNFQVNGWNVLIVAVMEQYNHIAYNSPDDLEKRLFQRIRATIIY
jgi:hypothetical protein